MSLPFLLLACWGGTTAWAPSGHDLTACRLGALGLRCGMLLYELLLQLPQIALEASHFFVVQVIECIQALLHLQELQRQIRCFGGIKAKTRWLVVLAWHVILFLCLRYAASDRTDG